MAELAIGTPPRRHAAARPVSRIRRTGSWSAYALSAPAVISLVLLLLAPCLVVLGLSLTDWQFGARRIAFVGLDNYVAILSDGLARRSLGNTLIYVGIVVPASVVLGLMVALLIESGRRGRATFRTIYFLPVMSTLVAMAVVWEFMMHPSLGLLNLVLRQIGYGGVNWLGDGGTVLYALAAIGVWSSVGFNMVLFLAGLKSIPRDLYDAAAVDAADGVWSRFVTVTWPMLGPTTMFVVIITAAQAFKVFETVAVMTRGGPNRASEVLLHTIYVEGFSYFRTGYASALTVIFLIFVLAVTLLQARIFDRRVHYG